MRVWGVMKRVATKGRAEKVARVSMHGTRAVDA